MQEITRAFLKRHTVAKQLTEGELRLAIQIADGYSRVRMCNVRGQIVLSGESPHTPDLWEKFVIRDSQSKANPAFLGCKKLGTARTVGQLRQLISKYPDATSFGFRNQPMQSLHEVRYSNGTCVVFQ